MKIIDDELTNISNRDEYTEIINMVSVQVEHTKEGALLFAIFSRAVCDAFAVKMPLEDRKSAIAYLKGDMLHLELLGVDVDWVKGLLNKTKLYRGKF